MGKDADIFKLEFTTGNDCPYMTLTRLSSIVI